MLAQALISCDKAQKGHEKVVYRLKQRLVAAEDQANSDLRRQYKLERDHQRMKESCAELLEKVKNQEAVSQETQQVHEAEKKELHELYQIEKEERVCDEMDHFQQKLIKLQAINTELSEKVIAAKKTEECLQVTNEELTQVKEDFFKAH